MATEAPGPARLPETGIVVPTTIPGSGWTSVGANTVAGAVPGGESEPKGLSACTESAWVLWSELYRTTGEPGTPGEGTTVNSLSEAAVPEAAKSSSTASIRSGPPSESALVEDLGLWSARAAVTQTFLTRTCASNTPSAPSNAWISSTITGDANVRRKNAAPGEVALQAVCESPS